MLLASSANTSEAEMLICKYTSYIKKDDIGLPLNSSGIWIILHSIFIFLWQLVFVSRASGTENWVEYKLNRNAFFQWETLLCEGTAPSCCLTAASTHCINTTIGSSYGSWAVRSLGVLPHLFLSLCCRKKDVVLNDPGGCWEVRDRFSKTKMLKLNRHAALF